MKLIKRNGSEVIFDREKISVAVAKANEAVDEQYRISNEDVENIAYVIGNSINESLHEESFYL